MGDLRQDGEDCQVTKAAPRSTFVAATSSPSWDWGARPAASARWNLATSPFAAALSNDSFAAAIVSWDLTVGAWLVPWRLFGVGAEAVSMSRS